VVATDIPYPKPELQRVQWIQTPAMTACTGLGMWEWQSFKIWFQVTLPFDGSRPGFFVLSLECEKEVLASLCPTLRLSVRTEQHGSKWTDFHGIYLNIFKKSVVKIKSSLKSYSNNNRYCTCACKIICRSELLRMRNVLDKSCEEDQNTHFVFNFLV